MTPAVPHPRPLAAFWRTLTHFDRQQVNLWLGIRNALGIVLPLAVAVYLGYPSSGLVAATGALNVAAADGVDSYRNRATRMLTSSVIGAAAVLIAALAARNAAASLVLSVLWAFAAGFLVCLGTAAGDIGMISLVVFVIYNAQTMTPSHAVGAGVIALVGGLFQTALSVAIWPFHGRRPERRAIANFYTELARAATLPPEPYAAPLASQQSTQAQAALSSLIGDHHVEAERLFALVSQGERIRLSLFSLRRAMVRVQREQGAESAAASIGEFLQATSLLLSTAGRFLEGESISEFAPEWLSQLDDVAAAMRECAGCPTSPAAQPHLLDARAQMDALAGQLRAALDLAGSTTPGGEIAFREREARKRWNLKLSGWTATLAANFSLDSSACRHAIRLAICIAIGDIFAHVLALPRSYWVNMTVALVLKPDFGNTFSRGVLRLVGTYAGLTAVTALLLFTPGTPAAHVVWIGILAFLIRWLGRANYGILVTALSALIVFLFSLTGVAPRDVISSRAIYSTIGGALALAIYWIWPTRERTQAPQALASMLDAYRLYFQSVARAYLDGPSVDARELDRLRVSGRLSRSNLETSVDRLSAEPFANTYQVRLANATLATTHRFIHAAMALEAGMTSSASAPWSGAFQTFSHDVEKTLYFLAARLRGSPLAAGTLPDLRADHNRLAESAGDSSLAIETDRMTNSLNTLAEQIFRWAGDGSEKW